MALSTGRGKLYNSMKVLRAHWERVKDVWNDPVQHEFEEKFWNELDQHVQGTLRGTDRLDQVLTTMFRECTPERGE